MESIKDENDPGSNHRASDRPAIALRAGGESNVIAGNILRARQRGYEVFLVSYESYHEECLDFADQLDVPIITVNSPHKTDTYEPFRGEIRNQGYPGVIYHDQPGESIDFEKSGTALRESDQYVVESVKNSIVESEPVVLVAIPAYNEESTIKEVATEAGEYADKVLVIDDGSDDETVARAKSAGATVVEHETNKGYGGALKTAFQEADRSNAAHLVIIDGDGQHSTADIKRLVTRQQETDAELVVGCRFDEDETSVPLYRRFGLSIVNTLTNLSLGVVRPSSWIQDTQNGLRAYDQRAIKSLAEDETIGDHMGASTDILHHAQAQGYDIEEVGTTVRYDVEDGSSHHPIQHGLTLVSNLLTTIETKRPLLILGIPGLILACIGIGFGYWTFTRYLTANVFPVGRAISSVFFTLSGVFAAFTGIILHALKQYLRSTDE